MSQNEAEKLFLVQWIWKFGTNPISVDDAIELRNTFNREQKLHPGDFHLLLQPLIHVGFIAHDEKTMKITQKGIDYAWRDN